MTEHFADRLLEAISRKGVPACVGIDPVVDRLPRALLDGGQADGSDRSATVHAIREFCLAVIDRVAELVPAVKINSAFFERYHETGVRCYYELVGHARRRGLVVIGDVKRGDIGHSSEFYAQAQLADGPGERVGPDAVTVNAYLGVDALQPFLDVAVREGKGVFALVQTSNESADQFQGLTLEDGTKLVERVAATVNEWAGERRLMGSSGYSALGAVVAPRSEAMTRRVRELMPRCLFLVPGFGAQGRTADEVNWCFQSGGRGGLVTASRSVIYAYQNSAYRERFGDDWRECVSQSCRDFVSALRGVLTAS